MVQRLLLRSGDDMTLNEGGLVTVHHEDLQATVAAQEELPRPVWACVELTVDGRNVGAAHHKDVHASGAQCLDASPDVPRIGFPVDYRSTVPVEHDRLEGLIDRS